MRRTKRFLVSMMMCMAMVGVTTSCSDNEENAPAMPVAKSVEGSYHGDMTCTVMGEESVFENRTFTVTATDDATVVVTISSFGNPPMQVPEIVVEGVKVTGESGNNTLASTEFSGTTDAGKAYSGTFQGSIADNRLTAMFNLQYGAMPMPMICTFSAHSK